MLKVILFLAAVLAVAHSQDARDPTTVNVRGCGRPNGPRVDYSKIVGGQVADDHRWNWQISMVYLGSHRCGGSIINSQWVLTAAHCTVGISASNVNVRAGSHNRTMGGTLHPVSRIVNHPSYGSGATYANDVALMKLTTPLTYTEKVAPACLANSTITTDKIQGKPAIVTGWGTLASGGTSPNVLHQVTVKIDTDAECTRAYGTSFRADSMVCASDSGKDSCQGDSGGPLFMDRGDYVHGLVGIVSWGRGCALPGYPGVYSKVANLYDWIEATVRVN